MLTYHFKGTESRARSSVSLLTSLPAGGGYSNSVVQGQWVQLPLPASCLLPLFPLPHSLDRTLALMPSCLPFHTYTNTQRQTPATLWSPACDKNRKPPSHPSLKTYRFPPGLTQSLPNSQEAVRLVSQSTAVLTFSSCKSIVWSHNSVDTQATCRAPNEKKKKEHNN